MDAEEIQYEKVNLPKNQFIRQETMNTLTYMKFSFPFKLPDFRKRGIESIGNMSGSVIGMKRRCP